MQFLKNRISNEMCARVILSFLKRAWKDPGYEDLEENTDEKDLNRKGNKLYYDPLPKIFKRYNTIKLLTYLDPKHNKFEFRPTGINGITFNRPEIDDTLSFYLNTDNSVFNDPTKLSIIVRGPDDFIIKIETPKNTEEDKTNTEGVYRFVDRLSNLLKQNSSIYVKNLKENRKKQFEGSINRFYNTLGNIQGVKKSKPIEGDSIYKNLRIELNNGLFIEVSPWFGEEQEFFDYVFSIEVEDSNGEEALSTKYNIDLQGDGLSPEDIYEKVKKLANLSPEEISNEFTNIDQLGGRINYWKWMYDNVLKVSPSDKEVAQRSLKLLEEIKNKFPELRSYVRQEYPHNGIIVDNIGIKPSGKESFEIYKDLSNEPDGMVNKEELYNIIKNIG